jgi:hypothetical protein
MSKGIGLALSCIDYRLFDSTVDLLKDRSCVSAFDQTILAGASLGYNQHKYHHWKPTFLNHVDLAIKLHDIKKIVVIDHDDCGAYHLFYPDTKDDLDLERHYHIKNIKKIIRKLKRKYPDMIYSGYLLHLDGSAEQIYSDGC